MKVQVPADIRSVEDFGDHVEVRGYQNYDAYAYKVVPVGTGKQHAWANTEAKWNIVNNALSGLPNIRTYADIGCNLGLYVMTAALNQCLVATGYDYDQAYIDVCNGVKNKFGIPCTFSAKPFSEITESFDCVSSLGLIHHLYHHTESYGNLEQIVARHSRLTERYLILEFPNEKDPKAAKWVNMSGRVRAGEYSEQEFLRLAGQHFESISELERVHPDRPMYLMSKV